jgi:hypothetical protein
VGIARFTVRVLTAAIALTALGSQRALAQPLDSPVPVTLRLRDVPAREAYAALAKQTDFRIGYTWGPPPDDRRVTLNLVHEPFWEALVRINKSVGMEIAWVRRSPRWEIALVPGKYQRSQHAVGSVADGVFVATLSDRTSDKDFRAPVDPTKSVATRLEIKLWAEPKVRGMYWHSIKIEEFVDETGRPIERKAVPRSIPFKDGLGYMIIDLRERPWPRRIGKLLLTSKVVTAVKSDVAEITDLQLDESPAIEAGGFRIETRSAEFPKGRHITLNLTPLGVDLPDWMRLHGSNYLFEPIGVDSAGRRLGMFVYGRTALGQNRRLQMQVTTPDRRPNEIVYGQPEKLYMDLPTELADYDVKLEFTDVKLY